jgi:hypothetical protein
MYWAESGRDNRLHYKKSAVDGVKTNFVCFIIIKIISSEPSPFSATPPQLDITSLPHIYREGTRILRGVDIPWAVVYNTHVSAGPSAVLSKE